ncbi:hypothetical protein [Streptomyces sp. NPDC053069]|uniref:hypothetical protein n=1 Tax=Streptomyces sp. NPDC053069 TaxID=3365695 RepID=UPI0037CEFC44
MAEVERPFPLPASREEQEEWIEAAIATPGANVPRGALSNIAPFLVEPKELLGAADAAGRRRLEDRALRRIVTDAGDMTVVTVRMHGVGGIVWENNERISSAWHSLADPSGVTEQRRVLARVHPWTRVTPDGREEAYAALRSTVASREDLIADVELAAEALSGRVGHRPYDLRQDLILNGQQEPGLYVAQHFQLDEAPLTGQDGEPLHPAEHWGWMAVRGNNRTKARQEIFGVTSAEVLTGVPLRKLGGDGDKFIFDVDEWLARLSESLNEEYLDAGGWDPDSTCRAVRARNVAVVQAHLVIGSTTPRRLYRIVQSSNRRDHVHPPLEFLHNDRSRALARSVLGAYVAAGRLDERTAEVLSGSAPITELPGAPSDATVSELRDLRSMMLLTELFPTDREKRFVIRRVLSESPPSQLTAPEVNQRARAWSALTSESYPKAWNPRIGEMFQVSDVREGIRLSGRPLRDLLAAAETDDEAFEELVSYRAAHWLAAFGIIDADRGSLTGQKADEDDGTEATRVRRTVRNTLNALRNNSRKQAVGVLRELALAMDQNDRPPLRVNRSGQPDVVPMKAAWFNREFPKETGKRPNRPIVPGARTAPPAMAVTARQPASPPSASAPAVTTPPPPQAQALPAAPLPTGPQQTTVLGTTGPSCLEQWAGELKARVGRLLDESRLAKDVLDRMADRARADGVASAFGRGQADAIVRDVSRTLRVLRELPELVEGLAETEPETEAGAGDGAGDEPGP